jgi:hypothetical protein
LRRKATARPVAALRDSAGILAVEAKSDFSKLSLPLSNKDNFCRGFQKVEGGASVILLKLRLQSQRGAFDIPKHWHITHVF